MAKYVMEPKEVSNIMLAFPANVVKEYMIPYNEIPEEYKNFNQRTEGGKFFMDMFYCGITDVEITPREGIDPEKAWRHIRAISGSFEPKHEHKEACVAFLLEHWFSKLKWKKIEQPAT